MTRQHNNGVCPECGSDPFKTQDYDKITKEIAEISSRYKRAHASWAGVSAEWEIKNLRLEEGMKWLQRKVKKQAQAIQKLEDKLKRHGERPYAAMEEPGEFTVRTFGGSIAIEEK